ncbi:MAG TPA: hypothetical protein ENJ77_00080 [Candidatus Moranbacteria bacterium]|nr:hypothetical protein [Candidatus Moranbacteria bacterium]
MTWFFAGLKSIKAFHRALVFFLGRRTAMELDEGPAWLPPLVMSQQSFSVKQETSTVSIEEIPTATQEEVSIEGSVLWQPACGYLRVYSQLQYPGYTVEKWLRQQIVRATAELDMDRVIRKNCLREAVLSDFSAGALHREGDRLIVPHLGVEVIDVQITSVKQPPQAAAAADRVRRESREAVAERTQLLARLEQAVEILRTAEDNGEEMSFAEAWDRASIEGGFLQGIKISGGDSLSQIIALLAKRGVKKDEDH